MDAKTFERNAQGDFYLYYRKSSSNQITYLTGTRDLHESSYIEKELPDNARRKNSDGSYHIVANEDGSVNVLNNNRVAVWSWNSYKLRFLPLSRIVKIVPLSSVLGNSNAGRSRR